MKFSCEIVYISAVFFFVLVFGLVNSKLRYIEYTQTEMARGNRETNSIWMLFTPS